MSSIPSLVAPGMFAEMCMSSLLFSFQLWHTYPHTVDVGTDTLFLIWTHNNLMIQVKKYWHPLTKKAACETLGLEYLIYYSVYSIQIIFNIKKKKAKEY